MNGYETETRPGLRRGRRLSGFGAVVAVVAIVVAIVVVGIGLGRGCLDGQHAGSPLLSAEARKSASRSLARDGVRLTIEEPVGLARKSEPVTSGVPLPEGGVSDVGQLSLKNSAGSAIPCQFTPLSRWPDGSLKWVLLDFQADVGASQKVEYVLCRNGESSIRPAAPVRLTSAGDTLKLETGDLKLAISSNAPGLLHEMKLDGKTLVNRDNPLQTTLIDADNRVYRASKPDSVTVEVVGPMRTAVRVSGHYVSEDGRKIFDGKVGYDVRLTAYAGRPDVRVEFTFKNDGWYGYRNEHKQRQWLYFRELRLDLPVPAGAGHVLDVGGTNGPFGADSEVTQWFKYPMLSMRSIRDEEFDSERKLFRQIWPNAWFEPGRAFYWSARTDAGVRAIAGRLSGAFALGPAMEGGIQVAVRRFVENFPSGARWDGERLSLLFLPNGGFWPRTPDAHAARTYQFEGGRRKTWELSLTAGSEDRRANMSARLDRPLFARAPPAWYRDTGAVLPFGLGEPKTQDAELKEAWERYDRLRRAKGDVEAGDPAGPMMPGGGHPGSARQAPSLGKVSIPSLWNRAPEEFMGWMNYGDLVWGFGYCSLFYQWPYIMHQAYLRLGVRGCFDTGEDMIRHRHDIDQYHVENTQPYLGGFQRYEKGEHGHMARLAESLGRKQMPWEQNSNPSHTWNRDLLLHWVLTGNPRSLAAAEQNGRAFRRYFRGRRNWEGTNHFAMSEFRVPGWGIENFLALYEYTGGADWLKSAEEVFDKTLLAMERANGSQGHIIRNGEQCSKFLMYIIEPVCRLHHYTGRPEVRDFLRRVLDYQLVRRSSGGVCMGDVYRVTQWQLQDWDETPEQAGRSWASAYSIGLLDGYAYLYLTTGKFQYLEVARRLFKESIFYYGHGFEGPRAYRTPLGFHYQGTAVGLHAVKLHAMLGRYGQLYMQIENARNPRGRKEWR